MNKQIKIEDYFKKEYRNLSSRDWKEINKIRNEINSFDDEYYQYKYIYERRLSSFNRYEDQRLFNIDQTAEILNNFTHKENQYYNNEKNQNKNINSNIPKLDYKKRDLKGNFKYDKNGQIKEYNKIGKYFINFANNSLRTSLGKNIYFIVKNFKAIAIMSLSVILSIALICIGVYTFGIINSLGKTPFIICGSDEITGAQIVQIPDAQVKEMATTEYALNAFISVAKNRQWTPNAIVGALSYILTESSGMGTFTYESFFLIPGPSGVKLDKTLNNEMWLNWLNDPQTHQNMIKSYHGAYYNQSHYAIGLGLIQDSDVWDNGQKTTSNATKMIEYAQEKGKPWQDPLTQIEFILDTKFKQPTAFDTKGIDPTKDNFSAEEWCRRITAGIGMPIYSWTDNNLYMQNHLKYLTQAQFIYESFTGESIGSINETTKNYCKGADSVISGGNATIADAAVTLAGTDKTKIVWDIDGANSPNLNDERLKTYKQKHIELFMNDEYFASCDRSAATAIIWSGADKSFPKGDTETQYNYLKNSDKWSYVGDYGETTELKPGDVLITKGQGHIKIYVGNEAVQKRFPGSDSDMYAGSYHDYFPRLYKDNSNNDARIYAIFRNVKVDN